MAVTVSRNERGKELSFVHFFSGAWSVVVVVCLVSSAVYRIHDCRRCRLSTNRGERKEREEREHCRRSALSRAGWHAGWQAERLPSGVSFAASACFLIFVSRLSLSLSLDAHSLPVRFVEMLWGPDVVLGGSEEWRERRELLCFSGCCWSRCFLFACVADSMLLCTFSFLLSRSRSLRGRALVAAWRSGRRSVAAFLPAGAVFS